MTHIHQKTLRPNHLLSSLVLAFGIVLGSMGCSASASTAEGTVSVKNLHATLAQDKTTRVLDVRTLREYDAGHISGALNVPVKYLATDLEKMDAEKSQEIYVVSMEGARAAEAVAVLRAEGYTNVSQVDGGMNAWTAKGYSVN